MNKEEIKNLIATAIAGQGSMVDVGGALPKILDAIVDMAGGALSAYVLEQDVPQNTQVEITRNVYAALMNSLAISKKDGQGHTEIIPRADALMFGATSGEYNALQQLVFETIDDSAHTGNISAVFVRGSYPYDEGVASGQFDIYVILADYSGANPVYYLNHIFKDV